MEHPKERGVSYLSSEITSASECILVVQVATEDNTELYLKAEQE